MIKPKTALITGASSGIGLEFAKIFASKGVNLIITARNKVALEELATDISNSYKISVNIIIADLAEEDGAEKLFVAVEKLGIKIDFLINNAGFGNFGNFSTNLLLKEKELLNVNINSLTTLTKLFIPHLTETKGNILNVASIVAYFPGPNFATYHASKAYVLSFSLGLRADLRKNGINVTVLCPGSTATKFFTNSKINVDIGSMSARSVAQAGYYGLLKKKAIVVPGITNKLFATIINIIPKELALLLIGIFYSSIKLI